MKKTLLLLAIFLLLTGFIFTQELVVINNDLVLRFREPSFFIFDGKVFAELSVFGKMGAQIVYSKVTGKGYIVNDKNVLSFNVNEDTITLNFIKKLRDGIFPKNGKVYLDAKIVGEFLNYSFEKGWNYYLLKGKLPKIVKIDYIPGRSLSFTLDYNGSIKNLFHAERKASSFEVRFFPVELGRDLKVPLGLKISTDGVVMVLEIDFGKPVDFSQIVAGNTVTFSFRLFSSEYEDYKELAPGVVWYRKKEKLGKFNLKVNYLEIDKNSEYEFLPSFSLQGLGKLAKVDEMVQKERALAGVNGNYFDPVMGFPIGLVVRNGKVLSVPYQGRPALVETFSGDYYIVSVMSEVDVKIKDRFFLVNAINNPSKSNVVVYTPEYAHKIPFLGNRLYFVVKNHRISEKKYVSKAPLNGFVISITANFAEYLKDVKIGDEARIYLNMGSFPFTVKNAVEGGPRILENGKVISYIEEEKKRYNAGIIIKRAPRTIVAIKPPSKLVFIVIDGYQSDSSGLTFEELADFLMEKGYIDAMCLDGGSSSVMIVEDKIVNEPIRRGGPSISVGIVIKKKK
ncbi:MAG: phosphodiester glycosidase family protein [Thermotogae bacterium]|nr:phosphodiester glycosidase family protein [Thermotogota bacterium]